VLTGVMEGQRGVAMTYGKPLTCYHCDYGDHWHVTKVENHLLALQSLNFDVNY
jgi:hypothetical protein